MRVLVVHCHPVGLSFGAACRDAVLAGLAAGGHEHRLIDLYAESFRPELAEHEWRGHADGVRDHDVVGHQDALRWAEALVLVHPTWWGMQPAMLRGWFDRVLAPGVAFELSSSGRVVGRLRNIRRLVVVTTHGSPRWLNVVQGEAGRRLVGRGLRVLVNPLARTRWIALYSIDTCGDEERQGFLRRVEAAAARRRL